MLEDTAKHPDEKIDRLQPVIEPNELSVPFGKREILKNLQIAPSPAMAMGCLVIFTLFVLAVSGLRARKLEINYSTD